MNPSPKRKPQVTLAVKQAKVRRYQAILKGGYTEKTAMKMVKSTTRTLREWIKELSAEPQTLSSSHKANE